MARRSSASTVLLGVPTPVKLVESRENCLRLSAIGSNVPVKPQVQKGCGCIIGKDYPKPIVDHKDVSKDNMGKMHDAYDANKEAEAASSDSDDDGGGSGGGNSSAPKKKAKR